MEKKMNMKKIKKAVKNKLACKGCGHVHNKVHPTTNNCPVCLCCHHVELSSINKPRFILYVGIRKLGDVVADTHKWWKSFDVKGMCTAEEVCNKIELYLVELEGKKVKK